MYTLNCKGKLIDLSSAKVMGILNLTPDSFYDGGQYKTDAAILQQVEKMLIEGATFIDIGAYSSRPNAVHISESEEMQRITAIVKLLIKNFPEVLLSIDTFRSRVARECIALGAAMINDISAGSIDNEMFKTVAELRVPYILMHMQGTPQNMQKKPTYQDITKDLIHFFSKKIAELRTLHVNDIIIDPGFGFGKTLQHNYELLNNLELFSSLDAPILTGISRKSMLYKLLGSTPENALNATTVAHTIALIKGTRLLRVHDVKEAQEAITIVETLKQA